MEVHLILRVVLFPALSSQFSLSILLGSMVLGNLLSMPQTGWAGPPPQDSSGATEEATDAVRWSDAATAALDLMEIPEGYQKRLVGAEPLVRDPVAFGIDEKGRAYVCESARQEDGVEDNRSSPYWLMDDLGLQTVDERLAMYEKHQDRRQGGMGYYTAHEDRLTRLVDSDGDGILDERTLFTPPYVEPLDGTLAGVLVEEGQAWIANIPHLWKASDTDDDGVADEHVSLQRGFGVRIALRGHDMHGLVRGPDGRIYWSIGDRGYHLTTEDGRLLRDPGSGAVFRCEPDGSRLEVVHVGLRNPQELAFNDRGDLFTGDNNSDAGDRARLMQIVWGAETGWRMEYQTLEGSNQRGPWNQEGIWQLEHPVRPVWALAPIAHLTSGPSGFVHYPGTGLPQDNDGCFFLCDFRGSPGNSSVWRFRLENRGAGFELARPEVFINKVLCTDVDFTPDGKMWVSAWGGGWTSTDRGRLMEVWHPDSHKESESQRVRHWLTCDLGSLPSEQVSGLLDHDDRRVRQRVQFFLVSRGDEEAISLLLDTALDGSSVRARRHGVWGVGQWARVNQQGTSAQMKKLISLRGDDEEQVREQLAKVLGDLPEIGSETLVQLLDDPAARVRFQAALSVGRIGVRECVDRLFEMARTDGVSDPLLRHAAVMGLAGSATVSDLLERAISTDREERLAVLLALRKRGHPGLLFPGKSPDELRISPGAHPALAIFLADEDAQIATEAARAIHDLPVADALEALADRAVVLAAAPQGQINSLGEHRMPYLRRVIDAALRHGDSSHAAALVGLAGRSDVPLEARREALRSVAQWLEPEIRDRVRGTIRPFSSTPRAHSEVAKAIGTGLLQLIGTGGELMGLARHAASVHGVSLPYEVNLSILTDAEQSNRHRVQALRQMVTTHPDRAVEIREVARSMDESALRIEAERLEPDQGKRVDALLEIVRGEVVLESRQRAIRALGEEVADPRVRSRLDSWLDQLESGKWPTELALDLLIAAEMAGEDDLGRRARTLREGDGSDRVADFSWASAGGNSDRGRVVFRDHPQAQCQRCHSLNGSGGVAGPALDGVASRRTRLEILGSLVDPSAILEEGYATETGISAMPEVHWILELDEIRDLLEFVSIQRD